MSTLTDDQEGDATALAARQGKVMAAAQLVATLTEEQKIRAPLLCHHPDDSESHLPAWRTSRQRRHRTSRGNKETVDQAANDPSRARVFRRVLNNRGWTVALFNSWFTAHEDPGQHNGESNKFAGGPLFAIFLKNQRRNSAGRHETRRARRCVAERGPGDQSAK